MNFKLKALVAAAVVAMSASGVANAIPQNNMFLVAYDSVSQKSFVADLGFAAATFSNTAPITPYNYTADANWTSFITGSNASNIQYQVLGTDGLTKIYTTSNDITTPGLNGRFANAVGGLGFGGALNLFLANNTGVTNYVPSTAAFGKASEIGIDWSTAFNNFTTVANLGENDNFYQITKVLPKASQQLSLTTYMQADGVTNSFWNLSTAGVLSYSTAAVPEADTSAMALMGLGLMGLVARRRRAV